MEDHLFPSFFLSLPLCCSRLSSHPPSTPTCTPCTSKDRSVPEITWKSKYLESKQDSNVGPLPLQERGTLHGLSKFYPQDVSAPHTPPLEIPPSKGGSVQHCREVGDFHHGSRSAVKDGPTSNRSRTQQPLNITVS